MLKDLTTSRQGFLPAYDADSCVQCGAVLRMGQRVRLRQAWREG